MLSFAIRVRQRRKSLILGAGKPIRLFEPHKSDTPYKLSNE